MDRDVPGGEPAVQRWICHGFDPTRGGLVVFGGGVPPFRWTGTTWEPIGASTAQQARANGIAWFDPVAAQPIFAQGSSPGVSAEMWALDGQGQWNQVLANAGPSPRSSVGLAYDSHRGALVMFGGVGAALFDETWTLDGDTWILLPAAKRATARAATGGTMAYDSRRRRMVVFGGVLDDSVTWEWDGATWTDVATLRPPWRDTTSLVYDADAGVVTLHAGKRFRDNINFSDTWTWDGVMWRDVTQPSPPGPGPRLRHGMTYDPVARRTVLFGGHDGVNAYFWPETWGWTAQQGWTLLTSTSIPLVRSFVVMTTDTRRNEVILFGGLYGSATDQYLDTWGFDGAQWYRIPAPQPTPRPTHAATLAYDPLRGRAILVGESTYELAWRSELASEVCISTVDRDRDGLSGCADPDCKAACHACGDGTCDGVESCRSCPADCMCVARCGDTFCDAGEAANCPGDCP